VVTMTQVAKGRGRRVNRRLAKSESRDIQVEGVSDENSKDRTVSGETLVNIENPSQSTLIKEGIAALDLPWNMSEVFTKNGKDDMLAKTTEADDASQSSRDAEDAEEERLRIENAAAKKAKIEENNK